MDFKARMKNWYFWLGIAGVVLLAGGVDWQTLTSWKLLIEALLGILSNPAALISMFLGFIGVFVDTSSKGFKDRKDVE